MEKEIYGHIKELEKEIENYEQKIKNLSGKVSLGKITDKDVANLVEIYNKVRERRYAIINLYQILGKASR